MIIFWLPLVSAALVLHLKTVAHGCVTVNAILEVLCIFGNILLLEVSHHFYSNIILQ